ncbi:MAG: hypothetical protein JXR76_24420 [Deltaproteobacteria bacterium]|nr:hypothetical protein [Deltaproteobacteria bacterium]
MPYVIARAIHRNMAMWLVPENVELINGSNKLISDAAIAFGTAENDGTILEQKA